MTDMVAKRHAARFGLLAAARLDGWRLEHEEQLGPDRVFDFLVGTKRVRVVIRDDYLAKENASGIAAMVNDLLADARYALSCQQSWFEVMGVGIAGIPTS